MQAPPNRTVHALLCQQQRRLSSRSLRSSGSQRSQVCVCLCSQQHSFQLGSPSSDNMRAALSVRRRRCHQITQQLGAFAAQSSISLEDQRSHGHTITLRFLRFPSDCSHPWFRRTFVVTFCVRASHADVHPELLQDAREPGDHIQKKDGAPHHRCCFVVVSHPVVELRDMALQVRVAPCLFNEPAQGEVCWTARCGLVLAPPYWQQNGWKGCAARDCSHMSPSLPFRRAHVERGPASGVAPSRSDVAILHCAFCANSVGDLCMAIQHVPVPGPPALSMMACCSGSISLCSFAACTEFSAAAKILDCSFANAMSRARLSGGTLSADCTGAGRTISEARLSAAHGPASNWHQF